MEDCFAAYACGAWSYLVMSYKRVLGQEDLPPVSKMTFPDRSGMSSSGLYLKCIFELQLE